MKGHDVRRTGQSKNKGPLSIDPAQSWTADAPGGIVLNIGASIDEHGVYFGSWGLMRRSIPGNDPRRWDKSDGKLYGLDLETGAPLWGDALDLDLTPRCYEYPGRGPNLLWCGFTPYEVSFYNGTVEGQAAIDTSRNVLYVGRGDGKLYAVDPEAGRTLWRYRTFNPERLDDPDGGGEVVSSPLLDDDGNIYFGTWGEGTYETNAFYAVHPDSSLAWRYPSASSLTHRIFASPALSPDHTTIYVSTFRDNDGTLPATLYAFHRAPLNATPDQQRLKWALDLEQNGLPMQTTTLAVGTDGAIYVGGLSPEGFGVPVLTAIEDLGDRAAFKWDPPYVTLRDGAQLVLGIALREVAGQTERLYATTANLGTALFNTKEEGALYAVEPLTGRVVASYDPSDDVGTAVGSVNSPAIDANGAIYFGVRGRFGNAPVNGYYFGVTYDAQAERFEKRWHFEVDGYVEWSHPAIGPDGGLYAGSAVNQSTDEIRGGIYDEGVIPEGSTPLFYALKGPTLPVRTDPPLQAPPPFRFTSAYPNPFATQSVLELELSGAGSLHVQVVDVLGRTVAQLADGPVSAGRHTLTWDGRGVNGARLAGGIYFVRARWTDPATGQVFSTSRKLIRLTM